MSNKQVVVFGVHDSLSGQICQMIREFTDYEIKFFISTHNNKINIGKKHKDPNKKFTSVKNARFLEKKVYFSKAYINLIKKHNIDKCFILEDDQEVREGIYNKLKKNKINVLSFIHPSTFLGGKNTIEDGVIIFPKCYIAYKTDIKKCTIIQSNCSIDHHSVIGKFVNINPRLTTGGFVKIDNYSEIHLSVDIINRIKISKKCRIGAGSLVLKDCESSGIYYGRPAKKIKT